MRNKRMLKILISIFFTLGLTVSVFAENIVLVDKASQNIEKIKGKYSNVGNKSLKSNFKSTEKYKKLLKRIKQERNEEEFALYSFLYDDRIVINVKKFADVNVAVGKHKVAVKNGSLNLLKRYRDIVDYFKSNNIDSLEKIVEPEYFKQILELILKNYKLDEERLKSESKNFKFEKEQNNLQLKIKYLSEILNDEIYLKKARENYLKYVKEADVIDKTNFDVDLKEILSKSDVETNIVEKNLEIEQGQNQKLTFYRFLSTDMMDINVKRFSEDANGAVERHKTIVRNGVLGFLRKYEDIMNYFKTNKIDSLEKIVEPGHFKQILELILSNYSSDESKLKVEIENLEKGVEIDKIKLDYKIEKQKRIDDLKSMLDKNKEDDAEKERIRQENLKKEIENLKNNLENFKGDVFKEYVNRKKVSLENDLSYLQLNKKHLSEILNSEIYFEKTRQNYLEYVKEADRIDKTNFNDELNDILNKKCL